MGFFMARGGQFDDFLLNVTDLTQRTEDSIYTNQGCINMTNLVNNLGDGSTINFQITRQIGGFPEIVQHPSRSVNMVPDSNGTGGTWSINASIPFTSSGGAIAGGKWTYTGTGGASGTKIVTGTQFPVVPGQQYTFSGYIDGSHITVGTAVWIISDPTQGVAYATASQTVGVNGRVSTTFIVPFGVTSVIAYLNTNNCTVTNATTLVWSDPQLEPGASASAYVASGQVAAVSVAGVAKTQNVDYTVTNGIVSFVSPPAAGAAVTASFTNLYRVRFDVGTSRSGKEGIELSNFLYNVYECKEIQLISVRK